MACARRAWRCRPATLALVLAAGRKGRAFPLWLLLYSSGDFALAFLRADALPVALGLAALQWADLALTGAALGMWRWAGRKEKR